MLTTKPGATPAIGLLAAQYPGKIFRESPLARLVRHHAPDSAWKDGNFVMAFGRNGSAPEDNNFITKWGLSGIGHKNMKMVPGGVDPFGVHSPIFCGEK